MGLVAGFFLIVAIILVVCLIATEWRWLLAVAVPVGLLLTVLLTGR